MDIFFFWRREAGEDAGVVAGDDDNDDDDGEEEEEEWRGDEAWVVVTILNKLGTIPRCDGVIDRAGSEISLDVSQAPEWEGSADPGQQSFLYN